MSKPKDYNAQSVDALKTELEQLLKERFGLQMQKVTGQAVKTHLLKEIRRNVARIKTTLAAKGVHV